MRSYNKEDFNGKWCNETYCDFCNRKYYKNTYLGKFCCEECKNGQNNMKRFNHTQEFIELKMPTSVWWLVKAKESLTKYFNVDTPSELRKIDIEELSSDIIHKAINVLKTDKFERLSIYDKEQILGLIINTRYNYYGEDIENMCYV
ncbi:hypothetical protein K6119_01710 [Paracrocinitomix mangrovi]|uniref:hypothetical protein n=1 Tax=Paracrocinitomix mangrovi TaxID=2862509 RepID=UPI001C8D9E48|nr:hypothetical protein [Paracrocinitomix mangrovi]UKN02233.1 hypothetical protein K6119_01710 [Paracrocinitomix mangrovi]